jgi:hypothetical protein
MAKCNIRWVKDPIVHGNFGPSLAKLTLGNTASTPNVIVVKP